MNRIISVLSAVLMALFAWGGSALVGINNAAAATHGDNSISVSILNFESNDPAQWERLMRRSDADPLTLDDIRRLLGAGIGARTVEEMVRTRRVLAVASADTLVALKKAGADDDLLAAISAYALPPNRSISFMLNIDVASNISSPKGELPYLYVEFFNVERKEQEYLLSGGLGSILARHWKSDEVVDTSDPLLPRRVRRIRAWGVVPLLHPGKIEVRVLLVHRPGLTHLDDASIEERKRLRRFTIDYPAVSLRNDCELEVVVVRDPMVPGGFATPRTRLFCHWD